VNNIASVDEISSREICSLSWPRVQLPAAGGREILWFYLDRCHRNLWCPLSSYVDLTCLRRRITREKASGHGPITFIPTILTTTMYLKRIVLVFLSANLYHAGELNRFDCCYYVIAQFPVYFDDIIPTIAIYLNYKQFLFYFPNHLILCHIFSYKL